MSWPLLSIFSVQIAPNEVEGIASAFKRKDFSGFAEDGISLEGRHYLFIREQEGKLVMGKTKYEGVTLQATSTAIVIARCPVDGQLLKCNKAVDVIAKYLESVGI